MVTAAVDVSEGGADGLKVKAVGSDVSDVGCDDGCALGSTLGMALGWCSGIEDGISDGSGVGSCIGSATGMADCRRVGSFMGCEDGALVLTNEGNTILAVEVCDDGRCVWQHVGRGSGRMLGCDVAWRDGMDSGTTDGADFG